MASRACSFKYGWNGRRSRSLTASSRLAIGGAIFAVPFTVTVPASFSRADSDAVIGSLLTVLSPFTLKASWSRLKEAGLAGFWSSSLMA